MTDLETSRDALQWTLNALKAVSGGRPVRNLDEVIAHAESVLTSVPEAPDPTTHEQLLEREGRLVEALRIARKHIVLLDALTALDNSGALNTINEVLKVTPGD